MDWVTSDDSWDCRIVRWGNTGWLEGRRIVQCRYFMWVRQVESERDGDGLHWLWDSRRGEPGTVRGNGTLNECTLYLIIGHL